MDILSRLIKFRDYTEMSNSQFADHARIPRPTLSQFLNGRNKRLSDELATKLHEAFPNLNMMWLLFGEGSMLVDSNIEISEGKSEAKAGNSPTLPFDNQPDNRQLSLFPTDTIDEPIQKKEPVKRVFEPSRSNLEALANAMQETAASHDATKTVKFVMVVYSDFSNEVFVPSSSK